MSERYEIEGQVNSMDYGFLSGRDPKLLLIKTGTGGSIYGYNNKYFQIAQHFHSVGYHVLCCSTPIGINDLTSFQTAFDIAGSLLGQRFSMLSIYYMGVSKGAYQGILYGNTIPQIESLLLINSPMMINFTKQIATLRTIEKKCALVFGTKDPSFTFWPWLCQIENPYMELIEVSGADHNFKGFDEEFFSLPVKQFLSRDESSCTL